MSTFKFYCPAEITKAKDGDSNQSMKIAGIASTIDKDSDGEFLDPAGFEIEEFLELGLVNWHHQAKNSPITVIGEPTMAEIRPEGFYVECQLYKSSAMAREVFELAEIMKADSKKRKLGFSIEGSVLERKSSDKNHPDYNHISKALITGLAITHMPKNAKTFADIIKGKGIIEETDEDEEIEKDLSTESGAAITKESVDPKLKVLVKSKYSFISRDRESQFDTIFTTYPDITIEKAQNVYKILTKIESDMKLQNISDDSLEKAMQFLGFGAESENPFIEKADASLDPDTVADLMEKKTYGKDAKVKVENKEGSETEEEEETDEMDKEEKLEKSIASFILKSTQRTSKENSALGLLIKASLDGFNEMKEQREEDRKQLSKAIDTIADLKETIKSLGGQSSGRKSIIKARPFSEKESFEKSQQENILSTQKDVLVLSKSKDYRKVLDLVDNYCDSKGMRADLSKAVSSFEASKNLPFAVVEEIKRELGITIVD